MKLVAASVVNAAASVAVNAAASVASVVTRSRLPSTYRHGIIRKHKSHILHYINTKPKVYCVFRNKLQM